MNNIVAEAKRINQQEQYIPELEVGEIVELNDVWDGNGETPEESYSYFLGNDPDSGSPIWINYVFKILETKENPLDSIIKINEIEFL